MDKPIRVAQVIGVACNGGVEAVIMNYYRHIDKTKVQFDFLVESESKIINKEEIEKMGGKVIIIPSYKNLKRYNKELKRIFTENNYDIVHSNMNTLSVFPLRIAKKCGVKVRIAHSHSTSNKKEWKRNILKNILRPFSKVYATHYFACTEHAGEYLFGKKMSRSGKVTIINNAIEIERFQFNEKTRLDLRRKMKIEDKFVIGHVGRFVTQKNHDFLIDVFNEVSKKRKDAVLLLVGDGPLQEKMEKKVDDMGIKDKVIFYGTTNDTGKLYSAMDVFVFPSLYEGLGMVLVEAQMSGLRCLASTNVPKEAFLSEKCISLKLSDIDEWENNLVKAVNLKEERLINGANFEYDINKQVEKLEKIYKQQ